MKQEDQRAAVAENCGEAVSIEGTLLQKIKYGIATIQKAVSEYPNVAVACSFGKDSLVVLHLALQVKPDIEVFTVLTPMTPKETFEYKDQMEKLWNLNLKIYMSERKPIEDLWMSDPDKCCEIFKVEPTKRAIRNLNAWITGLRRTEGRTRTDYETFEPCGSALTRIPGKQIPTSLMKVNPILDWTELDIWRYIAINKIPINPIYNRGYRSLGCEPCTRLVKDTEPERAGRWKGTSKCGGECGIHTMHKKASDSG
jgi:phosphoadenosine phosphosulfate reductase